MPGKREETARPQGALKSKAGRGVLVGALFADRLPMAVAADFLDKMGKKSEIVLVPLLIEIPSKMSDYRDVFLDFFLFDIITIGLNHGFPPVGLNC